MSERSFCSGEPKECIRYRESECAQQPFCEWYGPPRCEADADCVKAWLLEDGGCSDVGMGVGATCIHEPRTIFVDFGGTCGTSPVTTPDLLHCGQ